MDSLTAIFRPVPEGFIAFVEELPGANAQGDSLEETWVNLRAAASDVAEFYSLAGAWALGPDVPTSEELRSWYGPDAERETL